MLEKDKNPKTLTSKLKWKRPVLSTLKVEEAESGNNVSENGITGS